MRRLIYYTFLSLFLAFSNYCYSQTNDISNYLNAYEGASINEKIAILYYIDEKFDYEDRDSILYYISDVQAEGIELNREDAIAMANAIMANYLRFNQLYDEALTKIDKAIDYYSSIGNDTLLTNVYNKKGNIYYLKGELTNAMIYYNRSLAYGEKSGRKEYMLLPNMNIARLNIQDKKFEEAKVILEDYIDYYSTEKSMTHLSNAYALLGQLYLDIEDFDKAKDYFNIGMECGLSSGKLVDIANGYTNMAIAEYFSDQIERSEKYFQLALSYRKKEGDKFYLSEGYYNLGDFFLGVEKYDSAVANYKKALILGKTIKNNALQLDILYRLNNLYEITGEQNNQILILQEIIEIQEQINKEQSAKTIELLNQSNRQEILQLENTASVRENEIINKIRLYQSTFKNWLWVVLISALLIIVGFLYTKQKKAKQNRE